MREKKEQQPNLAEVAVHVGEIMEMHGEHLGPPKGGRIRVRDELWHSPSQWIECVNDQ